MPDLQGQRGGAIDRDEVRDAFKAGGVKVLAGDWTNGDPAITRFLESRGPRRRAFSTCGTRPGKPPEELPQILTPSMLISRAQVGEALAPRATTFLPADPGLEHLRSAPAPARSTAVGSRSMKMKSAHLPGSSAPSRSSAKPA